MAGESVRPTVGVRIARTGARLRLDILLALFDLLIVFAAYGIALLLRFEGDIPEEYWRSFLYIAPFLAAAFVTANMVAGVYGHVWRYASIAEASRVVTAGTISTVLSGLVLYFFPERPVPLSVIVLGGGMTVAMMGLVRFVSRLFSYRRAHDPEATRVPALIVGATEAGAHIAGEMRREASRYDLVGFLDENPAMHGRRITGAPVLGGLERLVEMVQHYGIEQVILTESDADGMRNVVDRLGDVAVRLSVLPSLHETLHGAAGLSDIRDVEIADLLNRDEVQTDLSALADLLEGRRVLVTGAGGSIGSEIVRQVLEFRPAVLAALDRDETHLHDNQARWLDNGEVTCVLADLRDEEPIAQLMRRLQPEVIFHAAAHKHVPILERFPDEAVKTNVFATEHLLRCAEEVGTDLFVFISTDKAVRPSSIMGATKRLGEMLVHEAAGRARMRCASVRFGNVLGSRGSVVPRFVEQIKSGGPLTVTSEAMTRYFMTIEEAVQLVLQAGALTTGDEVFVLDMGEPVSILALAKRMVRLAGMVPGRDIEIQFVGLRPGEKLHEELSTDPLEDSKHPKVFLTRPAMPETMDLRGVLDDLRLSIAHQQRLMIRDVLARVVDPSWTVVDLRDPAGFGDTGEIRALPTAG